MRHILTLCFLLLALPAWAELRYYSLDPAQSEVEFIYRLNGNDGDGTMPIASAELALDFNAPNQSSARVTLDVTGTKTGAIFVTQALKSKDVLAADDFPTIGFRSRAFQGSLGGGAEVTGDVTIRGVTRPMTLRAEVFRARGSDVNDLSRLTVILTGHINRADFGATGYGDLVADRVDLMIRARLQETKP